MKWFLIACLAKGLSVAVSAPEKYSFIPHDNSFCEIMREDVERSYNEQGYTFKCEQHNEQPRRTGKLDRDLQVRLNWVCPEISKACGMLEEDGKRGLSPGTTAARWWKARAVK